MMIHAFFLLALLLLLLVQVSFVQALPFPWDRMPLVLVTVIYVYQYHARNEVCWWLIAYGLLLDTLSVSFAPMEWISYSASTLTMMYAVSRVFTNRSFYGMTATALLCLLALTLAQIFLTYLFAVFGSKPLPWEEIAMTHAWSFFFASVMLLFLIPWTQRMVKRFYP